MKILNLDAFNKDDSIVKLDGIDWRIPAEIPVGILFELLDAQQRFESKPDDVEAIDKMFTIFADIFSIRQPDLDIKQLKKLLTARQIVQLIVFLTENIYNEEEKKTDDEKSQKIIEPNEIDQ